MPKMYADRCFQTQRQKKTTKGWMKGRSKSGRSNKQQQGRSNKKPHHGSRNKKQKRQLSRLRRQHIGSLSVQNEDWQPLESQLNRGNQSSESNRLRHQKNNLIGFTNSLQMIHQPKKVAHVGNIWEESTVSKIDLQSPISDQTEYYRLLQVKGLLSFAQCWFRKLLLSF